MKAYRSGDGARRRPKATAATPISEADDDEDDDESLGTLSDYSATDDDETFETSASAGDRSRRPGHHDSNHKGGPIPAPIARGQHVRQRAGDDGSDMCQNHVSQGQAQGQGQGQVHITPPACPPAHGNPRPSPTSEAALHAPVACSRPTSMFPAIRTQPQFGPVPTQSHNQPRPQAFQPVANAAPIAAPVGVRAPPFNQGRLTSELEPSPVALQVNKPGIIIVDWVDHHKFTIVDNLPHWRHCVVDAALQAVNARSANPPEPRLVGLLKRVRIGQVSLDIKGLIDDLNPVVRSVSPNTNTNTHDGVLPTFEVQVRSGLPFPQREGVGARPPLTC